MKLTILYDEIFHAYSEEALKELESSVPGVAVSSLPRAQAGLEQLIDSLEKLHRGDVYLQIKTVAQTLSDMYSRSGVIVAGPPEYFDPDNEYKYVHSNDDLMQALVFMIGRENAIIDSLSPRKATYPRRMVFSIPEKIAEILDKLRSSGVMHIIELFYGSGSRTEIIATLVAVLELCRVGSVLLTGEGDEMKISYTGVGREPIKDFTEEE